MTARYKKPLAASPDPDTAAIRLGKLLDDDQARNWIETLPDELLADFIHLIAYSHFLYRHFSRHADSLELLTGDRQERFVDPGQLDGPEELRAWKYRELLRISWLDLRSAIPYGDILRQLSQLAQSVIRQVLEWIVRDRDYPRFMPHTVPFAVIAMGKLGARELNFSSDIDLIFVGADETDIEGDISDYQATVVHQIRQFNRVMEQVTEEGFLYRVDLKLRPWGSSGPLVLPVEEMEHYYEATKESWERFAWLRARVVAGHAPIGEAAIDCLQPFIYRRTLGSDDLQRFLQIKHDMAKQRQKAGNWNVKLGEGGIRDIEFFLQMLQIVNAHQHPVLKTTNTLSLLEGLVSEGFVLEDDGDRIRDSYLFLRRLENRLQMVDERQTHQLPDAEEQRVRIASSLGFGRHNDDNTLKSFNRALDRHRNIARSCFEKILPENHSVETNTG